MIGQGQEIGRCLAGRVGGLRVDRVRLVDGDVLGRAVDLAGGGMDHLHPILPGRLKDVIGSLYVGSDVGQRRDVGIGNAYQGGQVKHRIAALDGGFYQVVVTDVAGDDLYGIPTGRVLQPPPGVSGVIADKGTDRVPLLYQLFHKVRGNETARAGDEGFHLSSPVFQFSYLQSLLPGHRIDFGSDMPHKKEGNYVG